MTISYQKGITTSPSDFLCENGELAECINLAVDNEEMKVLTPAEEVLDLGNGHELFIVHNVDNGKNYIYYSEGNLWFVRNGVSEEVTPGFYPGPQSIHALGKTLIIETSSQTYYAIWNGSNYELVNELPSPEVEFSLQPYSGRGGYYATTVRGDSPDIFNDSPRSVIPNKEEEYLNLVFGLYAEAKKKVAEKNAFINPFFACAAIELYDGTFTRITNPVLLFPSVHQNHVFTWGTSIDISYLKVYPKALFASLKNGYEKYKDIVRKVVFFVSDEIDLVDVGSTEIGLINGGRADSIRRYYIPNSGGEYIENAYCSEQYGMYKGMIYKDENAVLEEIRTTGVFYKLCSVDGNAFEKANLSSLTRARLLQTITEQQQLPLDYFSNSQVFSTDKYIYNNRVNLIRPNRTFFPGFKHFIAYEGSSSQNYTIVVYIDTPSGERRVVKSVNTREIPGIWFYYPDPRAKKARIYNGSSYMELELKEHPGLNGAYYFRGMPTGSDSPSFPYSGNVPSLDATPEKNYNTIATSEVNNPWVFKAEGYNSIGNGDIIGVATQTQALSQGQFGQYPLLVFTSEGVWAMDVSNTGLYSCITPVSRDVCNNPKTIVETDNAVFFTTEKGLFVNAGSTVREMSRLFCGRKVNVMQLPTNVIPESEEGIVKAMSHTAGFRAFVNDGNTLAVYDYVNSRICFLNTTMDAAYAYHIDSGTLSQWLPEIPRSSIIIRVVRDYPHALIATSSGKSYHLHNDTADNDTAPAHYNGYMLTRPVKFGEPLTVHSLREMKHVGYWNEAGGSSVRMELLMSDDMINWYLAGSRFGAAAKYWRWALYVCMTPQERLSGTVVRTQQRRDNNLR